MLPNDHNSGCPKGETMTQRTMEYPLINHLPAYVVFMIIKMRTANTFSKNIVLFIVHWANNSQQFNEVTVC